MDFNVNVNVKFDATPALTGAVATLATAISGCAVVAPQVQKPLVTDSNMAFIPLPEQTQAAAPAVAATAEAPVQTAAVQSDTIPDTVVREAVAVKAKAGKKTEIKALLAEFGVKSSPELPQDRRAEFIAKINAL